MIEWNYYNTKWIGLQATDEWKATRASKRLVEEYMVRIESCSTFNDLGAN
ncbi:MAG: hypothetical protein IKT81_02625 [Clostridia bacterium]|nr:hypothetical protein [Clostridia bacterium]MBR4955515.1 hypothetical protein [Clostridia bacterium]